MRRLWVPKTSNNNYLKPHKSGLPDIAAYEKLLIRYEDNRLLLQAETCMNGTSIKGWYLMDTGSGGSLDFTAQTVSDYKLDAMAAKRYFTDFTQFGIGDKKQEVTVDMMSDINGQSVSEYSWDEEESLHHTPKQIPTIVTANGQEKQITLEAKEQW